MEFGVNYWVSVFTALWGFLDSFFNYFGAYAYVLGGFFVFVVVRFLIGPIFGIAVNVGSDQVIEAHDRYESQRLEINDKGEIKG